MGVAVDEAGQQQAPAAVEHLEYRVRAGDMGLDLRDAFIDDQHVGRGGPPRSDVSQEQ